MTLIVVPNLMYDPINLGKMMVLGTIGLSCLGIFLGEFRNFLNYLPKIFLALIAIFFLSLLVSFFFSGAPLSQQLWGSFGRNTGLLTYVSLIGVLLAATSLNNQYFLKKLLEVMVWTNIPFVFYCVIQVVGLDPVNWSAFAPFGTLGNVNFSSAFLGMCAVASTLLILEFKANLQKRLWLSALTLLNLFVIFKTDSIQGFFVFAAGIVSGLFFVFRKLLKSQNRIYFYFFVIANLMGASLTSLGIMNRGPLARFVFQETLDFRIDYMRAAIKMMLREPWTGVGLDSYGDWYRSDRDVVAAFRTSLNRTSNSAHNIFLDVGSNVGFFGFFSYLGFVIFVGIFSIRKLLKASEIDIYFVTAFACWLGYVLQALASINQIGVGIWGWVITGALLGRSLQPENSSEQNPKLNSKNKKKKDNQLKPLAAVLGFIGMVLGFSLAAIPVNADLKFQQGNAKLNLTDLVNASKTIGSTAIHLGKTVEIANNNKFIFQAKEVNDLLIKNYPREIFGWTIFRTLDNPSVDQVTYATQQLRNLDPVGSLCLNPDPVTDFLTLLRALPVEKQKDVVKYWGLPISTFADNARPFAVISPELRTRLQAFCQ